MVPWFARHCAPRPQGGAQLRRAARTPGAQPPARGTARGAVRQRPASDSPLGHHVLRHAVQGHMDEGPARRRLPQGVRCDRRLRGSRASWRALTRLCPAQAGDTNEGYDALTQRPDKSLIKLEPGARPSRRCAGEGGLTRRPRRALRGLLQAMRSPSLGQPATLLATT